MTHAAELIALLTAVPQEAGIGFDEDDTYIDWSTRDDQDRICVEVGAAGDTATLYLTREQLTEVYRALGTWLIQNPA
jgi:hypothetical protein